MNETVENETFYSVIRSTGSGYFEITVPKDVILMAGWNIGDTLKVMAHKVEGKKEE